MVDLHLRAMTAPEAKGQRFIAVAGACMSMLEVAGVLRAHLGIAAAKVPTKEAPDLLLRAMSLVRPQLKAVVPNLGVVRTASNEKAKRLLGWAPRSNEDIIVATAESLIRLGLVS